MCQLVSINSPLLLNELINQSNDCLCCYFHHTDLDEVNQLEILNKNMHLAVYHIFHIHNHEVTNNSPDSDMREVRVRPATQSGWGMKFVSEISWTLLITTEGSVKHNYETILLSTDKSWVSIEYSQSTCKLQCKLYLKKIKTRAMQT